MTIWYKWPEMFQLADDLEAQLKNLHEHSDLLQEEVDPKMKEAWHGGASQNYQDVQHRWNSEFSDTNAILNRLIREIRNAAETMMNTDRKLGNDIQGVG